jgi:hypothetical protein
MLTLPDEFPEDYKTEWNTNIKVYVYINALTNGQQNLFAKKSLTDVIYDHYSITKDVRVLQCLGLLVLTRLDSDHPQLGVGDFQWASEDILNKDFKEEILEGTSTKDASNA